MIDYSLVKRIYDVDVLVGCSEEEIDQLKQIYGAITEAAYEKLLTVVGNLGESV